MLSQLVLQGTCCPEHTCVWCDQAAVVNLQQGPHTIRLQYSGCCNALSVPLGCHMQLCERFAFHNLPAVLLVAVLSMQNLLVPHSIFCSTSTFVLACILPSPRHPTTQNRNNQPVYVCLIRRLNHYLTCSEPRSSTHSNKSATNS